MDIKELDINFLNKAERVTSLNLDVTDFTKTDYKKEIQYLFKKHYFNSFDISKIPNGLEAIAFNRLASELRSIDRGNFELVLRYPFRTSGVGPGEVLLYFLSNNSRLGGGSSAGVDVFVGSRKYEVKAAEVSNNVAKDFKLGSTVPLTSITTKLIDLNKKLGLSGSSVSIPGSVINTMRQKAPKEFKEIEDEYANIAYENYFKEHEVIFLNRNTGMIAAIKKVNAADILIERFTSNTIKPVVKL